MGFKMLLRRAGIEVLFENTEILNLVEPQG